MEKCIAKSCIAFLLILSAVIFFATPSDPEIAEKIGYMGLVFGGIGFAGIIAALLHR